MDRNKKKNGFLQLILRYGLPLLISVGLCYVLLTQVDFKQNVEIVGRYCNFWWIGLTLSLSVVSHIIRAARWGLQLKALDIKVPFFALVLSIFGTYAVNLVFPRLGEVWRTGYIANRQKVSFTRVFGSMVSDRFADMLTVLLITLVTFLLAAPMFMDYLSSSSQAVERLSSLIASPWLWTLIGLFVIGTWLLFTRFPQNRVVAKIREMVRGLWEGFIVIIKMKQLGLWLVYNFLLWGCYFVQLYVAFYAFDFTRQILDDYGIMAPLVCWVFSTIAMVIPSNGGIGPWQLAVVFGLAFYSAGIALPPGTDFQAMSIAFANCVMTSQTILLIVLGLFTFAAIAIEKRRKSSTQ